MLIFPFFKLCNPHRTAAYYIVSDSAAGYNKLSSSALECGILGEGFEIVWDTKRCESVVRDTWEGI